MPLVTGFRPPQKGHQPAGTERKTRVPASSFQVDLGQSCHLSSAAHLTPCISRCMAGGLLSSANGSNDGACHPSYGIVLHPAGIVSRLHEYAIRGDHLSDTFVGHKKKHCDLICGKHCTRLGFPRMLSVRLNVSLSISIDYEAGHRGTNNLPLLHPLPTPLPSYINRAGVYSSSGGCNGRKRNISVLLSYHTICF